MAIFNQDRSSWREAAADLWRVTFFGEPRRGWEAVGWRHLAIGLSATWLVGLGRWWDDPRDLPVYQRLGMMSVGYVFILALVLLGLISLMKQGCPPYRHMLIFVTMTALPAALYATPIEFWVDELTAVRLNLTLLSIVALWRVVLLILFIHRYLRTSAFYATLVVLIEMSLIVFFLTCFGLLHVVDIMGGTRGSREEILANYLGHVLMLCMIVCPLSGLLLGVYHWMHRR